ncbi:hypothetical protein GCM10011349_46380 [Novosphingobium indicum]|uniref:Uncharacterized protein n=1 Tax=Novosphingobium indicum TaxID=462949 RepID=A0ABQ2K093_9SPHN|nr:hypothetical protein [Novosphingobium indicum]GGN62570.1 hypothetical protein GCM10011349_46380 [Novosphingobium indicum]
MHPIPSNTKGLPGGGSLKGVLESEISQKAAPGALETLKRLDQPGGMMCTSCA